MINVESLLGTRPFELPPEEKNRSLLEGLNELVDLHQRNSVEYHRICEAFGIGTTRALSYAELPYLPVRLFKSLDLRSVPREQVARTMTSSGTSGQLRSRIHIDAETGTRQRRALAHIIGDLVGKQRLPMLVIDSPATASGSEGYSARTAGIQGFSVFSRERYFALSDSMELDLDGIKKFVHSYGDQKILVFGFTSIIWLHMIRQLDQMNESLKIPNGILLHGGGWKKIEQMSVGQKEFKASVRQLMGIPKVHDYYGMVEQTGSIYVECEMGVLHSSIYSDVIIRRPHDLSIAETGEVGLIQTMSILPLSYPGHVLLTEDIGSIVGLDGCGCGRRGTHFQVHGRLKNSEVRGCSDTYQEN